MEKEIAQRWIRTLERQIEKIGWSRKDRILSDPTKARPGLHRVPCEAKTPEEAREIYTALMLDAMAWSFEEYCTDRSDRMVFVFRGYLQARDAAAKCGYNSVTKDASIELQNAIEGAIRGYK